MGSDGACSSTGLALGLGFSIDHNQNQPIINRNKHKIDKEKILFLKMDHDKFPCLSLGSLQPQPPQKDDHTTIDDPSVSPTGSSYSNSSAVRRDKVGLGVEDLELDRAVSSRASDGDDEEASPRKKLRLTKEQSAVLEDSFKEHSTLNPNQKQALARQLNLRPRQVEVWFQNRRARTKLKQTEMDCELLKKCFDNLTEENKKLHRELQELRALNLAGPTQAVFMQTSAATLSMCPSCERINAKGGGGASRSSGGGGGGGAGRDKGQLCNPFAFSSKAC